MALGMGSVLGAHSLLLFPCIGSQREGSGWLPTGSMSVRWDANPRHNHLAMAFPNSSCDSIRACPADRKTQWASGARTPRTEKTNLAESPRDQLVLRSCTLIQFRVADCSSPSRACPPTPHPRDWIADGLPLKRRSGTLFTIVECIISAK